MMDFSAATFCMLCDNVAGKNQRHDFIETMTKKQVQELCLFLTKLLKHKMPQITKTPLLLALKKKLPILQLLMSRQDDMQSIKYALQKNKAMLKQLKKASSQKGGFLSQHTGGNILFRPHWIRGLHKFSQGVGKLLAAKKAGKQIVLQL